MNFPRLCLDSLLVLSCLHATAQAADAPRGGMERVELPAQPPSLDQAQRPGQDQPPIRGQGAPHKPQILPPPMPPPAPMPPLEPSRPEPFVQPEAPGPKTAEQKAYESTMQTRWTSAADAIVALKSEVESVQGPRQKAFRESLRTASGNRSMAKTKLNQLIRAPSADFDKLKTGVDRAFEDLDAAIQRARSHLAAQATP